MRGIFLSLILFSSVVLAQNQGPVLGLRSAIQTAYERNPGYRISAEKVIAAEEQIPIARAQILPNLSLVGQAANTKFAANAPSPTFGSDPYNYYRTDLKLTQPLFAIGTFAAIDTVKKDRDLAKLDAEIAGRDLISRVIQAYYRVVLTSRTVKMLLKQEEIVKESLATAERRERTGRGQRLDVLQVRTQIASLAAQLADAKNQVQVAAANLATLLGDTSAKEFSVKDSLEAPELDQVDRNINLKNYRLPELEKNSVSLSQIDDRKRVRLGQNLPYMTFVGDYVFMSYKSADVFAEEAGSWTAMLQVTIPLFSGLSSIYEQRALASQQVQLELDRVNIQNQVNLQQVTSRKQLESAHQSIISGTEALRLATASSEEARRNYRFATIDFLQFLTVQKSYVEAESSLNTYKYNYLVSLANYFVASGQSLGTLVELMERNGR